MKPYYILSFMLAATLTSCQDLDLNPLSSASTENWYSTSDEIQMSMRDLYKPSLWGVDDILWTDDYTKRSETSAIIDGTLNGLSGEAVDLWDKQYALISRANSIIERSNRALAKGVPPKQIAEFRGEAKFFRACGYSKLVNHYGDVPYIDKETSIEEALQIGRTPKAEINKHIYEDFDSAINVLPVKRTAEQRITRGTAMGYKARHALYIGDWKEAAKQAKAVIDLGVYSLYPDFGELFLQKTQNPSEGIFVLPASLELEINRWPTLDVLPRTKGGYSYLYPSWDLLASFLCTDGKTIDKSPLFDSHQPFKNRDPRCAYTIVEFQSNFLGFGYDPSPTALTVYNFVTKKYDIPNKDTRATQQYASFNGLLFRKRIDETWLVGKVAENDHILMRLAEMYLTYAEAKIELGEVDQSVLDAINTVRARAYKVKKEDVTKYPAVTTTNVAELRQIVRIERRMEFAWEGMRYMDLVRWRLAEKALTRKNYGLLYPTKKIQMSDWFWASTPRIDADGLPDFTQLEADGKIQSLCERRWNNRQYLWPIPTKEIQINENIKQNEGY